MISVNSLVMIIAMQSLEETGGLGPLETILVLVILAGLIVLIRGIIQGIRRLSRASSAPLPVPTVPPTAVEILQERYGSGEITLEQYRRMMEDLSK